MTTRINDELLCAYLDDELDPSVRAEVEQALAADAELNAKLRNWATQADDLRRELDPELDDPIPAPLLYLLRTTPASAVAPVMRSHEVRPSLAKRLRQWVPSPRFSAGVAAGIIFGVFVGREIIPMLNTDGQLVRLASVAHHVYTPDQRRPVEVRGDDPTLTGWLSNRLGTKVLAPSVNGYHLMGGRLLTGTEEPAGQFMYEEPSGNRLTLFVRTEGAAGRRKRTECDEHKGVNVCYWYADGVAYALSGDLPRADLWALAESASALTKVGKP